MVIYLDEGAEGFKEREKERGKEKKESPPWNESTVNTVFFQVNPSPPFDDFLRNSSSI